MQGDRESALTELPPASDEDDSTIGGPGLVRSVWRYRLVIAVVTALVAVAASVVSLLLPVRYESEANLFLRDPGSPSILTLENMSTQSGGHDLFMAKQAAIADSDSVLARALRILGRTGTPDDLRGSVKVTPSSDQAAITIKATSGSPAEAARVANAVGTAYGQVAGENLSAQSDAAVRRLWRVITERANELDGLRAAMADAKGSQAAVLQTKAVHVANLIGALQVHQDNVQAQAAMYGNGVEMFQPATVPAPSSRNRSLLFALFGAVLGLGAAGSWAWRRAGKDRRVDTEEDASAILGVPMLGEAPKLEVMSGGADGPVQPSKRAGQDGAEAYHIVLASLEHALRRAAGKTVLVVSATPGEGKTMVALNLALAARQAGRRPLLVDADERSRQLSKWCRDRHQFEVVEVSHDSRVPALTGVATVLQVGPSERNDHHPAGLFRSPDFQRLLTCTGEPADVVLIDTPALLEASDAVRAADHADVILMVVKLGTPLADLRAARDRLRFTDTPLVGYVLRPSGEPATGRTGMGLTARKGADRCWYPRWMPRRTPAGQAPQRAGDG